MQAWLTNETRKRPALFVKDLNNYMEHQEGLRDLIHEDAKHIRNGNRQGEK